jgi:Na+/alanine symporter
MDGAVYFKSWVEQGYLDTIQAFIRKYLICILAILIVMVTDVFFLIWRFHKGDLVSYRIKNLFSQESEKNSDERISENESHEKEERGW